MGAKEHAAFKRGAMEQLKQTEKRRMSIKYPEGTQNTGIGGQKSERNPNILVQLNRNLKISANLMAFDKRVHEPGMNMIDHKTMQIKVRIAF